MIAVHFGAGELPKIEPLAAINKKQMENIELMIGIFDPICRITNEESNEETNEESNEETNEECNEESNEESNEEANEETNEEIIDNNEETNDKPSEKNWILNPFDNKQ